MAETPLQGRRFEGLVTLREADPRAMIAVRGDLSADDLRQAVAEVAGTAMPDPLGANWGERGVVLWMAPDELLLLMAPEARDGALARLREAAGGPAADVSDMRAHLRLDGAAWRDVLAKLTPADVSPAALPPGIVRRTRVGQVAAALWALSDDALELVCFRSVAEYAFALLADAARPDAAVGHHLPKQAQP